MLRAVIDSLENLPSASCQGTGTGAGAGAGGDRRSEGAGLGKLGIL